MDLAVKKFFYCFQRQFSRKGHLYFLTCCKVIFEKKKKNDCQSRSHILLFNFNYRQCFIVVCSLTHVRHVFVYLYLYTRLSRKICWNTSHITFWKKITMRERKLSRDPCEINWIRCTVHKWQTVMQRCFYAALRIENDIVLSKYDDRTTRISMTIIVNSSFLQESRNLRAKSRKYKRKFYWHGAGWLVEIVKRRSCACCECEMHSIQ